MIWLVRGEILLHPHIKLGDVLKSQFSAPQITSLLQTCFGNSTPSPSRCPKMTIGFMKFNSLLGYEKRPRTCHTFIYEKRSSDRTGRRKRTFGYLE